MPIPSSASLHWPYYYFACALWDRIAVDVEIPYQYQLIHRNCCSFVFIVVAIQVSDTATTRWQRVRRMQRWVQQLLPNTAHWDYCSANRDLWKRGQASQRRRIKKNRRMPRLLSLISLNTKEQNTPLSTAEEQRKHDKEIEEPCVLLLHILAPRIRRVELQWK